MRYALDLAVRLGATLHLMHVLEDPFGPGAFMEIYAMPTPDYLVDIEKQAKARLDGALSPKDRELVPVMVTTRRGLPASEILLRAEEEPKIDLIVMSTHGRGGVARLVMGSVAVRVLRSAPCPVLTMRVHPNTLVVEPVRATQDPVAV